jgi:hypothetical protein
MILVECPETRERCLVESDEGYPGWIVLALDAPEPPHDHCDWCEKSRDWKSNASGEARAEMLSAIRDPEALLEIIEDLYAHIVALEATVIAT